MTITKKGLLLADTLERAGLAYQRGDRDQVLETLSLIARHTKTYTELHMNLCGWKMSGDYVNAHWDELNAKDAWLERRLEKLGRELAIWSTGGTPKLETHSLYGVTITVTDEKGISRERGVED